MSDTYIVNYRCGNCLIVIGVIVPRGKAADNKLECPRCGLTELRKTDPNAPPDYFRHLTADGKLE